ncbi:MAG: sulfite exporter TauE/SafE family protein [Methylococcales bacterium]|nr:sulfite exporter TauE/SafE family protein [Methylococcales bacterium]
MQCIGCEQTIEDTLKPLSGILKVKAHYASEQVDVEFDNQLIKQQTIKQRIEEKGYEVLLTEKKPKSNMVNTLIFLALLLIVGGIAFWGKSKMPALMPTLNDQMSNLVLFGIGFLTGFHCIGMCGSFVVSYVNQSTSTTKAILSHFAYGVGKTVSYSAIGAAFGLLGAVFTITTHMQGIAALAASVFLLLYGLKMLNLIPSLRHLSIRLPQSYTSNVNNRIKTKRNPLLIGALSGLLLGCGPLQAMYIMAAGTGDPQEGATLLFFFGLGTLIPLLGFGFFANLMSRHTIHQLVKVSGILVIIMSVMMANRGLKLTKTGYDFHSLQTKIIDYPLTHIQ